jgi:hypothetical protein
MPRQLIITPRRHFTLRATLRHYATPYFAIAILLTFFFLRRHCRYAIRHADAATPLSPPLFLAIADAKIFIISIITLIITPLRLPFFICQPLLSPLLFRHSLSFSSFRHFASIERFAG